jgi:hypothetical protein
MRITLCLTAAVVAALALNSARAGDAGRSDKAAPTVAAAGANTLVALDDKKADEKEEAEIQKNLGKLDEKDRKLADAQKYCAIEDDTRLGSMGVPVKITLKDSSGKEQPVFLCCKGCKKDAEKDPAATLAKVEKLKAKAKEEQKK